MFLGRISHTSQQPGKELAEPVFMDQTVGGDFGSGRGISMRQSRKTQRAGWIVGQGREAVLCAEHTPKWGT